MMDHPRHSAFPKFSNGTLAWPALFCGLLTALPLCGLVLFFEVTRPTQFSSVGLGAIQMRSGPLSEPVDKTIASYLTGPHTSVAHFNGVSAEVGFPGLDRRARTFTSADAERAFADASFLALRAGFTTEFVNRDRHRIALRILSRQPIMDQAVPDNTKLGVIAPASTSKVITFAWGNWVYHAEVEDKGPEPELVVQKVL